MKKIFLLPLLIIVPIIIIASSCSVNESPDISDINGYWKIYIGSEYSLHTKEIMINITDSGVIYDNIVLDSYVIENNTIAASKRYNKDSAFKINLVLTYKENYIWGHEYFERFQHTDSIYIFGEKIHLYKSNLPQTD